MSSGLALVVSAAPANADNDKVLVCQATGADSNPYLLNEVQRSKIENSKQTHTWQASGWWNGQWHLEGTKQAEFLEFQLGTTDTPVTQAYCAATVVALLGTVSADVNWNSVPASCATEGVATWAVVPSDHVSYTDQSGTVPVTGGSASVTATADDGYAFDGSGTTSIQLSHQFPSFDLSQCDTGTQQPVEVTPVVTFVDPTCESPTASWSGTAMDGVTRYYLSSGTVAPGNTVTVTATLADGYALAQGAKDTFEYTFADPSCQQEPKPVTPVVTFVDPTCDGVDASWSGTAMDGVTRYDLTAGEVGAGKTATVTATLADGYALAQGAEDTFEYTFADPTCQQDPGTQDPGTQDPGTQDPGTQDPGTQDPGTQDPGTSGEAVPPAHHHASTVSPKHQAHTHTKAAPRHAAESSQSVVTPTVVHAGLAGLPTPEQGTDIQTVGLAMSTGGALVLLSAGWLGLGLRRRDARTS